MLSISALVDYVDTTADGVSCRSQRCRTSTGMPVIQAIEMILQKRYPARFRADASR